MADVSNRNRQSAGQPVGGQFATEAKGTATGVTLGEFLAEARGDQVPVSELAVGDTIWEPWTGEQEVVGIDEIVSTGETVVRTADGTGQVFASDGTANLIRAVNDPTATSMSYVSTDDDPDVSAELGEVMAMPTWASYADHDDRVRRGSDWHPTNVDPVTGAVDALRVDEDGFAHPVLSRSPHEDSGRFAHDAEWLCGEAGATGWEADLTGGERQVTPHQVTGVLERAFDTRDGRAIFNGIDPYVPGTREDIAQVLHHARSGDTERTEAAIAAFVDRQAREGEVAQPSADATYVPPAPPTKSDRVGYPHSVGSHANDPDGPTTPVEVAAAARREVKEAVAAGYLPDVDWSVRTRSGGVEIEASGLSPQWGGEEAGRSLPARELRRRAEAILSQYNEGGSDASVDYYSRRFHQSVTLNTWTPLKSRSRQS